MKILNYLSAIVFLFSLFSFVLSLDAQVRLNVEGDVQVFGRINLESAGVHNAFVGLGAGTAISSGGDNAFFGIRSGFLNNSGNANTYLGYEAGRNNLSGSENVAVGRFAMPNSQINSKNIAIGSRALISFVDGFGRDPVVGNQDIGTTYNLAIGTNAGNSTNDPTRNGAERNTFVGNNSGLLNTIGYRNTSLGFQAGDSNVTGRYNTCIGNEADLSANNLFNAGVFGSDAVVNASNKIRIGDGGVTTVEGAGWSLPSDGRFKNKVEENVPGLDFLLSLRPVTYQFDVLKYNAHVQPEQDRSREDDPKSKERATNYKRASAVIQTGFIAQEVEATAEKLGFDFNGIITPTNPKDNYGLSYSLFVVPVVKGIQEQQELISGLQEENEQLKAQHQDMEDRIASLEAIVKRLERSRTLSAGDRETLKLTDARLYQNRPNPFKQGTAIAYFIPSAVQKATLEILGTDGRLLRSMTIAGREEGTLEIAAGTLAAGNYVYRLILDGKLLDAKTMVLTK